MSSIFCISSKLSGNTNTVGHVYVFMCILDVNMKYIFTVSHGKKMFENHCLEKYPPASHSAVSTRHSPPPVPTLRVRV